MPTCLLFAANHDEVRGLARDIDLVGLACDVRVLDASEPDAAPRLVGVWTGDDAGAALAFCQVLRKEDWMKDVPILLFVRPEHLRELLLREAAFDDFLVAPTQLPELDVRIRHLIGRVKVTERADVLTFGSLVINVATYQVSVHGKTLNLTFMEYELLKFLATHRGRVYTRQALLSQVWGYDYGGSRTVDVHVTRLRGKLGDRAAVIQTVRNVGYKFAG